jgi:hypothetical protein
MYLTLRYSAQFLGATGAALILFAFLRDGLGMPQHSIVIDALGLACILSLACALGAAVRHRTK